MNISEQAVEAAAKAMHDDIFGPGLWADALPPQRADLELQARVALKAAAPYMTATRPGIGG